MFVPRAVLNNKKFVEIPVQVGERATECASARFAENPEIAGPERKIAEKVSYVEEDDEPVVSYSKLQRWPEEGEPVCIVCGRYGAYIVDKTEQDVCSLECKARHLHKLGLPLVNQPNQLHTASAQEVVRADATTEWEFTEDSEVSGMKTSQMSELRKKMKIKVEGSDVPFPVLEFRHLHLPDQLTKNLETAGYQKLTAVQMQVIPATLYRRDLIVCSSTGSGKTLSFLLPIVLNILRRRGVSVDEGAVRRPAAIVLVPTRELAMQIEDTCKQLMKGLSRMRTALVVGGVPLAHQLYRLGSGVEVVIATPARLRDILDHHGDEVDVSCVEQFVVDEVDCMLHMGFKEQVMCIMEQLPSSKQILMFSATIPDWVGSMAKRLMKKDSITVVVGEPGVLCESVRHTVLWVEETSKKKKLLSFLNDQFHFRPPAIVFVGSKKGTLLLAHTINKRGIARATAVALHGDMVQQRRTEVVREFLDGRHSVMVATNVLARGMDLQTVHQVFVFDFPTNLLEYIHQVGRAGRLSDPGYAVTFINATNKSQFLGFYDLLNRLDVAIPSELVTSPYLSLQRDDRKRKIEEHDGGESTSSLSKKRAGSDLLKLLEKKGSQ